MSENESEPTRNENRPSWQNLNDSPTAAKSLISADNGEILKAKVLEKKVIDICERYKDAKKKDVKKPDEELNELTNLAKHYSRNINFREGTIGGTITKYRIHQGTLFLVIKKVVKFAGKKWQDWFDENFPKRELRSAQDYMKLAKAPDAIEYVALGKDRLRQILKYWGKKDEKKPIGKFFEDNGIDWQDSSAPKLDDLKFQVDVAITHQMFIKNKLEEISKEKVEELLMAVGKIGGQHMMELQGVKASGGDLIGCIDEMIENGGKRISASEPERNGNKINYAFQKFIDKIDAIINDTTSIPHINDEYINQLRLKITELEQHLTPN